MQMQELSAGHGVLTAVRTGAGRDIVVLHSLLADRHAFDPVLPALAAKHRVTLFNLPGFHGSEPVVTALLDAYVARIEDGFQEFGIDKDAILIGNGFGGTLALAFALEIPESGMAAAKKLVPEGYLTPATPSPFFVGVDHPMGVYTWDNMIFTNAKVSDDAVYKLIDTLEKNKTELVAVQPALREFSAANLYTAYDLPYHSGALKYFKEHNIQAKALQ